MFLSPSLQRIKPSATLALAARAQERKAQGHDVIDLGVGELDLPVPEFVQEAAVHAIQEGYHRYTAITGLLSLREAVCRKIQKDHHLTYNPSEVLVACGAKQVIFNAMVSTLSKGDEVIVPTPSWTSYPDIVQFTGGSPILVPCPESQSFKLSPADLEAALSPKTKWLILNTPNNPTGAVYGQEELGSLAAVLKKHPHVWILTDEIYETFLYDGLLPARMGQVAPFLRDRLLIINGLSKSYAMAGWRLGYGVGPLDLIRAMGTLQSQSTSCASVIAQKAAEAALSSDGAWEAHLQKCFQKRRDHFVEAFRSVEGLTIDPPQGAFYGYLNCRTFLNKKIPEGDVIETDTSLAQYLLEQGGVNTIPGSAFHFSPYLRLSYSTPSSLVSKAAICIQKALDQLT